MKVRQGFVSNSSSSSYIIRGVAVTEEEAIALVTGSKELTEDYELRDAMEDLFPFMSDIVAHDMRNSFDTYGDVGGYIVGKSLGSLDDGSFVEMRESSKEEDAEILVKLSKFGISGPLKTYVKMLSTDNF